jgi:two-component system, NtrC family, sensor kinase
VLERTAILLGTALAHHRTERALVERVKELTCLHGIARAVGRPGVELPAVLAEVAALLPPAWQYPDSARARIVLDGLVHGTAEVGAAWARQSAAILVGGEARGTVEVAYAEPRPYADEGPFLREERTLIDSVAQEVSSLVERRSSEEARAQLQEQLRHADRLATIGQLAAGVAHELNEPLATILGFAQLCRKHAGLPPPAAGDLDKIVAATLHAREVVKSLMLFARERPQVRGLVAIEHMVEEAIAFLGSRSRKDGIEIRRRLRPGLPQVLADPHQLVQVVVNLVVNAIQAMPHGGQVTIEAALEGDHVVVAVEDQGAGMTPETVERVFEPFFTTKDVGEGTGLGLAVVHGIVTAHGGHMRVHSELGKGSRFEVCLPIAGPGATGKAAAG